MLLFDTHAHYDATQFDEDRDAVLAALPDDGVALALNPGCDIPSSRKAVEYAAKYAHMYAAVGFHPENADTAAEGDIAALRALCAEPKVVAIGEIGLDYYWVTDEDARARQRALFRAQMQLARELSLPVIVHDREAHADSLEIIKEFPDVRGVFHCYSGSAEMAKILVDMGWMISFTGVLTFKNARKAHEVLRMLPPDRLMFETDSPYMAPEPHRGKRCDSRLVCHTVARAAELLGEDAEVLAERTYHNACRFFGIE